MKEHSNPNNDLWSHRYNISLSVRNFLKRDWIDFELCRPEMDVDQIIGLIEAAGFNQNHPEYSDLVSQAKQTFSLEEIAEFLKSISSLEVVNFAIEPAMLRVSIPEKPEKGVISVEIETFGEDFNFSKIERYSLPFEIVGKYEEVPF